MCIRDRFRDAGQELDREDYERLITAARESGRERIALVMETICATGIRVSEVRYITVEAAKAVSYTHLELISLPPEKCPH